MSNTTTCTNDTDCGSLTASCVNGKCLMSVGSNVSKNELEVLSNEDLTCMNYIDSGPYQGYYACPDARFVSGECSCGSCVQEPNDERSLGKSMRCCPKIIKEGDIELCDDSTPFGMTEVMRPTMAPASIAPIPEQVRPKEITNEFGVSDEKNPNQPGSKFMEAFSNMVNSDADKATIILLFLFVFFLGFIVCLN